MTARRGGRGRGRVLFGVAFTVLLLDGAGAVWLGQVWGRGLVEAAGLALIAAAAALVLLYRRWRRALEEVDAARRELEREVASLRDAAGIAGGRVSLPSGPGLGVTKR